MPHEKAVNFNFAGSPTYVESKQRFCLAFVPWKSKVGLGKGENLKKKKQLSPSPSLVAFSLLHHQLPHYYILRSNVRVRAWHHLESKHKPPLLCFAYHGQKERAMHCSCSSIYL
jgi:hypothetical protein